MNHRVLWMAAVLLLMAGQATAQEAAPRDWGEHGMSPMTMILEHGDELGLSDEQVARLEAIGTSLRARTAPLRERMREAMGDLPVPGPRVGGGEEGPRRGRAAPRAMTPEQREAMRERARELRPVREEIREIQREAREEARAVLTTDQQQRLRELMRERRGELRRRGGEARRGRAGGRA